MASNTPVSHKKAKGNRRLISPALPLLICEEGQKV